MRRIANPAVLAALPLVCGGCMSIFVDGDQVIEVATTGTEGAYCQVVDKTGRRKEVAYTPGFVKMARGDGPMNVRCEKDGFRAPDQTVPETFNSWTVLTGFLFWPGFVWDLASGSYQKYPDRVIVPMTQSDQPRQTTSTLPTGEQRQSAIVEALGPNDEGRPLPGALDSGQDTVGRTNAGNRTGATANGGRAVQTGDAGPAAGEDPYADVRFGASGFAAPGDAADSDMRSLEQDMADLSARFAEDSSGAVDTGPIVPLPPASEPSDGESGTLTQEERDLIAAVTAGQDANEAFPQSEPTTAADPSARPAARRPPPAPRAMSPRPSPVDPRDAMVLVPPPSTGFGVQVGAYSVRDYADNEIAFINSLGFTPYTRQSRNGRLTMVRFGPFADRQAAQAAARTYLQAGGGEAVVVSN